VWKAGHKFCNETDPECALVLSGDCHPGLRGFHCDAERFIASSLSLRRRDGPQEIFNPGDPSSVVEDFQGGKNGNYRLRRGGQSHCKKAPAFAGVSPGGKDPGADVDAVNAATAGVD
jgi:hypothetical protein